MNSTVDPGASFAVQVRGVGFTDNVVGGGFNFSFNPLVVSLSSVVVNTAVWEFVSSPGTINNAAGTLVDVFFNSNRLVLPTGNFDIATLNFTAIGEGSSALTLAASPDFPFANDNIEIINVHFRRRQRERGARALHLGHDGPGPGAVAAGAAPSPAGLSHSQACRPRGASSPRGLCRCGGCRKMGLPRASACRIAPMPRVATDSRCVLSPGLAQAPVLDVLCSHFVLTLTLRQAGRFNLRRDWNSLLSLVGPHLVWPQPVLGRVRSFLAKRCKGQAPWKGAEALSDEAFIRRHGPWQGPYEEGTLFFYIDEYIKDAPKDLLTVLATSCDWLARRLKRENTLVQKNIDALAGLLQLNPAERALLLYGTLARYQRDLRGLLVEFKVSNAQEAYAAIAAVAGVEPAEVAEALRAGSRLERIGMVENLISEQNITDLADLMKVSEQLPPVLMREYRAPGELMAVFTRPGGGQ